MIVLDCTVHEPEPRTGGWNRQDQAICLLDVSRIRGGDRGDLVDLCLAGQWIRIEGKLDDVRAAWERARAA